MPHDFVRADGSGEPAELDQFETLRPDAVLQIAGDAGPAIDVFVERDDRHASARWAAKQKLKNLVDGVSIMRKELGLQ